MLKLVKSQYYQLHLSCTHSLSHHPQVFVPLEEDSLHLKAELFAKYQVRILKSLITLLIIITLLLLTLMALPTLLTLLHADPTNPTNPTNLLTLPGWCGDLRTVFGACACLQPR
jgi:hypothetical protein